MQHSFRTAFFKSAIVLVPSYAAAYLTEQMVYVVPTLAAAGFFASSLELGETEIERRVEGDLEDAQDTLSDGPPLYNSEFSEVQDL
ncbi:hypothetical protein PhaeoP23_02211 [Phaeobacter piscinae]|uniref:Uncharacterized protein n=1 Tax=Phaeobacter piscinae TaxID=1580596 RepID=A0ABM6PEZ9_9RHOB|nr:hypothetical protein [Phaeobacter piscinae]ATG36336.1 hypothetical protein PhaeoP36_02211 [Phaeobacter piscinae]AUQ86857.1 hypothetical protein PhaeoP42_02212 [Phaeobacter piscinae]AUR24740.1 hypothetical protein PhaeoP23_02211 [Phaeobacter piscinae]